MEMTTTRHPLVPDSMLDRVAHRFRVLGDATRLSILRLLVDRGELSVGQIVDDLAMSQANVSKHLRLLLDAGVLTKRRAGTSAYYTVADPSIETLCSLICDRLEAQAGIEALAVRR